MEDRPAGDLGQNSQKIHLWRWLRKYTSHVYRKPYIAATFAVVLTVALTLWLVLAYGVNPGGNTNYYRWTGHNTTDRWDAYVGAGKGSYGSIMGLLGSSIPMPKQFQLTQMGCVIYERYEMNVLEAPAMREIWRMEKQMRATPGWSDYCFKVPLDGLPSFLQDFVKQLIHDMEAVLAPMEEDTHCIAFKSLFTELGIFMEEKLNLTSPDDLTDEILWDFFNFEDPDEPDRFARLNGTYMGTDFARDTQRRFLSGSRMRSMFPFAFPIAGYRNKADREKEQIAKLGRWQEQLVQPAKDMQEKRPLNIAAFSAFPFALDYDIAALILKQVWWLVGSFSLRFVFGVVVFG
jgi:hypothetical protein